MTRKTQGTCCKGLAARQALRSNSIARGAKTGFRSYEMFKYCFPKRPKQFVFDVRKCRQNPPKFSLFRPKGSLNIRIRKPIGVLRYIYIGPTTCHTDHYKFEVLSQQVNLDAEGRASRSILVISLSMCAPLSLRPRCPSQVLLFRVSQGLAKPH